MVDERYIKKPIEVIIAGKYRIELYDETGYNSNPINSVYKNAYLEESPYKLPLIIGIRLFADNVYKASCLIGSEGASAGLDRSSIIATDKALIICCSNSVFKLTIPDLNLEWKSNADYVSCLNIFPLGEDFIVHGEIYITRLSNAGEIMWQVSGRDIWLTHSGLDDFKMFDTYILATDWEMNRYKIDFEGNILEDYKTE